eukprot:2207288-Pyramimonas_sp.AAC.1
MSPEFVEAPYVDVFSAGFACQPFSSEGKNQGVADRRADVVGPILSYVHHRKPQAVIFENVTGILQQKNLPVLNRILTSLSRA